MDPVTINTLAKAYQQELIDRSANGGWGTPADKELQAILDERKNLSLWRPRARFSLLVWPRRLFSSLANTLKAVDTRQSERATYGADPCAAECE